MKPAHILWWFTKQNSNSYYDIMSKSYVVTSCKYSRTGTVI